MPIVQPESAVLSADRFSQMWIGLGARNAETFEMVRANYGDPARHYHNAEHIGECLAWFDQVRDLATNPLELEAAIWFHDVIYDVSAHDNEKRSADLVRAEAVRAGIPPERARRIGDLVETTAHHDCASTSDAALLSDIDLSILGSSPARFDRYSRDIRREYSAVPEDVYRVARTAVLDTFLRRTTIYGSPYVRERLERNARDNLVRAVQQLQQ